MKGASQGRQFRALVATSLGYAATYLSFYGISVALPTIGRELETTSVQLEWVLNASLLAFAAPLIAIGRLIDIFGVRANVIVGSLLIIVGAAMCGLSPDIHFLIASRAVQGVGMAMLAIAAIALISDVFEGKSQSVGIGILTAIGMIVGAMGPLVAGVITDSLSWRWFFFLISGVAALGLVLFLMLAEKGTREEADKKFDVSGFVLLTAGLLLLILGLQFVDADGWLVPDVLGCIGVAIVCLVVFYFVEKKVASPLVDFTFFRQASFTGAFLVLFFIYFPYGALMFYLSLYLQHVLNYSAVATGVIYLALMLPTTAISLLGGQALNFAGPRFTLTASVALILVGFVYFGFVHPTTGLGVVIVGLLLVGAGRGSTSSLPIAIGLSTVPKRRTGAASGILETVSTITLPIGVATFGAFYRVWENDQLAHVFKVAGATMSANDKADVFGVLHASPAMHAKLASIAPQLAERVKLIADEAFSHAFRNLVFVSIALFVAVTVSIYLMRSDGSNVESGQTGKS